MSMNAAERIIDALAETIERMTIQLCRQKLLDGNPLINEPPEDVLGCLAWCVAERLSERLKNRVPEAIRRAARNEDLM